MFDILYRSGLLIFIILFGYLVKFFGWFSKEEDFATISKLMINITLPTVVMDIASIIGSANTFLAMFMIGLALELRFDRSVVQKLSKYMALRYVPAILAVIGLSFVTIVPREMIYALSLLLMAPIAGSAPVFTDLIGNDVELSAQVNSLSIIISIVLMSSYLVYLGG